MIENRYLEFFEQFKKFKEKQQKQKQRGLNDYNLLTTVLNEHDEVRLHSRVIGSLLDVDGLHYQNEIFLEKFFEVLQINEFGYDMTQSRVMIEYQNIDLYLTDGTKHIIIENKIYASDQNDQIKRYCSIIRNENNDLAYNDLLVIYLSIDRAQPSEYSLGDLRVSENTLVDENGEAIALFKNINYNKEILQWLNSCIYEIQNITNLNESIIQYKCVVEKITNTYKEKVMSLKDELLKNEEYYELAKEISKAYENANNIKNDELEKSFIDNILTDLESLHLDSRCIERVDKNRWHCLDIKANYFIRIFRNEDGATIQITDINKPFSNVEKDKKEIILNNLQNIAKFKSGWSQTYAVLIIPNSDIDQFDYIDLISKIMSSKI